MAETIPGGIYKVGDEYQDANGKKVDPPKDTQALDAASTSTGTTAPEDPSRGPGVGGAAARKAETAWPDGFPSADLLQAGGVKSATDAQAMSRDDLIALEGIGPARADAILAWKA
jgi:DNA uptake protein ComE-like DNA-binding protein